MKGDKNMAIYKTTFDVAGISYRKANLKKLEEWLSYSYDQEEYNETWYFKKTNSDYYTRNVKLVREPENEFDKNAIKVLVNNIHIGYVPKNIAKKMAKFIDCGKYKYIAELEYDYFDKDLIFVHVNIILFDMDELPDTEPYEILDIDGKQILNQQINNEQNNLSTEIVEGNEIDKQKNNGFITGFIIALTLIIVLFYAIFSSI